MARSPEKDDTNVPAPSFAKGVGTPPQLINLNEGQFDKAVFGTQENEYHIEANRIDHANIFHIHHHYDKKGSESSVDGYVRLEHDLFINTGKCVEESAEVHDGYQILSSGEKHHVWIRQIVPCEERDIAEVQRLESLPHHPNVVQITRSSMFQSLVHKELYIGMERCEQRNLSDVLMQNRENGLSFTFDQSFSYSKQLISGMEHIHRNGIVHGDLKLENILIPKHDEQLKVSFFGNSKKPWFVKSKSKVPMSGADGFQSPETYIEGAITAMSDIFVLGIILFLLFADGEHPFGKDPDLWVYCIKNSVGPDLSSLPDEMGATEREQLLDLLVKMLDRDPRNRPTIEEVSRHPFFWLRDSGVKQASSSSHSVKQSCRTRSGTVRTTAKAPAIFNPVCEPSIAELPDLRELATSIPQMEICPLIKSQTDSVITSARYEDPFGPGQTLFMDAPNDQLEHPSFIMELPESIAVLEGGELELECCAIGQPEPSVLWTKDGKALKKYTTFENGMACFLKKKVGKSDEGTYVCVAKNELGLCKSTCKATVITRNKFRKNPFIA